MSIAVNPSNDLPPQRRRRSAAEASPEATEPSLKLVEAPTRRRGSKKAAAAEAETPPEAVETTPIEVAPGDPETAPQFSVSKINVWQ